MRDVYEMWHSPQRHKDSAIIGGKEIDIYVDRQHHLCVPYASIYAHAAEIDGIRVAALEHLLALKCAAAEVRAGTGKGERDVRDLAQITMLLDAPRAALLFPYLDSERRRFLENTLMRPDLEMRPKPAMDLEIPAPTPLRGENRDHALRLDTWSIAEICGEAGIRYRVTGGTPPAVALWDNSFHGFTVTDEGESRCVVSTAKLPPPGPERALRIMEILAYGFQDYFARESMCGRGHFAPPTR